MNALNQQASEALPSQRSALVAEMVEREFVRHPELEQRYGKTVRARMIEDTGYHLDYLAQAIADPIRQALASIRVSLGDSQEFDPATSQRSFAISEVSLER